MREQEEEEQLPIWVIKFTDRTLQQIAWVGRDENTANCVLPRSAPTQIHYKHVRKLRGYVLAEKDICDCRLYDTPVIWTVARDEMEAYVQATRWLDKRRKGAST